MKNEIQNKLKKIEGERNIKILYACESGSRGWEFPSPDSDYDVRFIYIRSLNEYLSVDECADDLTFQLNDELDLHGWDLRKTLQLIRKSNTTPFEWLQSPIVYLEEGGFRENLMDVCKHYFSCRSTVHHYLGITRGALETMNTDGSIKIKKLFYVLRPLLAAKWCLEKRTIAPMSITSLSDLIPSVLRREVELLIKQKSNAGEGQLIKPNAILLNWIQATEQDCIALSNNLEKDQFNPALLNDFFRTTLRRYDDTGT